MLAWQELAYHLTDHGCAAEATPGEDFETVFAVGAAHDVYADIMHQRGGAILWRTGDGNFEFPRQVGEFGMEGRPLPNDFAPGARILEFVGRYPCEVIRLGVSNAVAAGLNRVHLDGRKLGQYRSEERRVGKECRS